MARFSIELRELRESDFETSGACDFANTEDGGCAILIDGVLVAIVNEYGSAFVNEVELEASTLNARDAVEELCRRATDLLAVYESNQNRECAYCGVNIEVHPDGGWMSLKTFDEKVCPENPGEGTFHWPKDLLEPESCDGCGLPFGEYDGRYHKHCG